MNSSLSDVDLGAIPCVFGTAENMMHRARVAKGEIVVVVGASGGVGSAAVQLALRRGAVVTATTSKEKVDAMQQLGCNKVLLRDDDVLSNLGENYADVIVENVGGDRFPIWLKLLAGM